MIILIGIIAIIAIVVGSIIYNGASWEFEDFGGILSILGTLVLVICIIASVVMGANIKQLDVIDEKITMYQEENAAIEAQIDTIVKQYQEYENKIFTETSKESSITLVSLYPDLKSDTLVQEQITVYTENNQKIKELKESKINGSVYRWWLYFGG